MNKKIQLLFLLVKEFFLIFKLIKNTKNTQNPIKFSMWFLQRVIGFNRFVYWPVHFTSTVANYRNVDVGIDTSPGYSPGCYIQALGKISIGDYTQIGPNVGIISANHKANDNKEHQLGEVKIGKYCWIGMNSMILPNVELGDFTVVGAGSVVTKSFSEGYCVIGGNPAKIIKKIDKNECIKSKSDYEYNGYIPSSEYDKFKNIFLNQ